jgi:iron complex outermembrane receptor protein
VRTPSRVEHDIDVTIGTSPHDPVFLRWLGDADFASETQHSIELGYRAQLGRRVSVDVAGFHNWHDKLLGLDPAGVTVEPDRLILLVQSANALQGRSVGGGASVILQATSRWLVRAHYAYLDLELDRRPGSESLTTGADEEGSSPRHQGGVSTVLNVGSHVEIAASLRAVDDLPAQHVRAYAELDARVGWRVTPTLELALVGQNLLHARHLEFVGDAPTPSEIQRAVLATVRVRW